ncbi:hypothetical protein IJ114_00540 [Candidatus Saccharibacteria bacterium]|nr:hypothetical protein [Candidatus Saccharibacteria bacterium]
MCSSNFKQPDKEDFNKLFRNLQKFIEGCEFSDSITKLMLSNHDGGSAWTGDCFMNLSQVREINSKSSGAEIKAFRKRKLFNLDLTLLGDNNTDVTETEHLFSWTTFHTKWRTDDDDSANSLKFLGCRISVNSCIASPEVNYGQLLFEINHFIEDYDSSDFALVEE